MSIFNKLKQGLCIGTVKVELQIPAQANTRLEGSMFSTSDSQEIKTI